MAKKTNSEELDLFYLKDSKSINKNKSKSKIKSSNSKKVNKIKTKKVNKSKLNKDNKNTPSKNKFDFDNEIIIGVTKIPEKNQKVKNNKSLKNKKIVKKNKIRKEEKLEKQISRKINIEDEKNNIRNNKNEINKRQKKRTQKKIKVTIPKTEEQIQKEIKLAKILKGVIIAIIVLTAIIVTMLSPLFNIKEVKVSGNSKISTDKIISLSNIQIGENTYRINTLSIKDKIKKNAYIEDVEIKRNLPSQIEIIIKERVATFMIEYINSYVYINNQGYMLEISNEKLELPILKGIKTSQSDIVEGKRLCNEDLEKLSTVLKIMEISEVNGINNLISQVNISNDNNYTLVMENEQKIVYLGDCSNLSTRILTLKAILERNQGIEGEIFIDKDLNTNYPVFRQKV